MEKRGVAKIIRVAIFLVLTITIVHTTLHLALYGTGISGFGERGISGFSVGNISGDAVKIQYKQISSFSRIIIIAEWLFLIGLIFLSFSAEKLHIKKEANVIAKLEIKHEKSKTEIDTLYDLLKEKKKLTLSSVAHAFNVKEETVEEWAKILETAELATLYYPRIGEPELRIKE